MLVGVGVQQRLVQNVLVGGRGAATVSTKCVGGGRGAATVSTKCFSGGRGAKLFGPNIRPFLNKLYQHSTSFTPTLLGTSENGDTETCDIETTTIVVPEKTGLALIVINCYPHCFLKQLGAQDQGIYPEMYSDGDDKTQALEI